MGLSLTARIRCLETSFADFESSIATKVFQQLDKRLQDKVDAKLADLQVGNATSELSHLVQHVSLEQMQARSQLLVMNNDIAALKARLSAEQLGPSSNDRVQLPGALAHLDELCQHVALKLEASADAEADMRGQLAELRSEMSHAKETAPATPAIGLGGALMQFDAICRQLAQQVEAASDREADLRRQITDVKTQAQKAERGIEELRCQVRDEKESISGSDNLLQRKSFMSLKGQFDVDFPRADCTAMDMDLSWRTGVAHSPKSLRMKPLKGKLNESPFASHAFERAPSCPALPPLASVW